MGEAKQTPYFKKPCTGEHKDKIQQRIQREKKKGRPLKHSIFTRIDFFKN